MPDLKFTAMPTEVARAYQAGAPDANGLQPETRISATSDGLCRHCLSPVPANRPYLVLAYRPFPQPQPYAEVGPIFLHAEACERHSDTDGMPASFLDTPDYLIKGYGADNRIVYGTGQVVASASIPEAAAMILERDDVRFVDVRSARNNCYQARIVRD